MIRKFFLRDKNYVLEEAQLALKDSLLTYLVDFVKVEYLLQHNPLGLVDETVQHIMNHKGTDHSRLDSFYLTLMGIFRHRYYGDNQLEFLFDGDEPYDKYCREWETTFREWAKSFCVHQRFMWGVLELTVFHPAQDEALFIGKRLQVFLSDYFDMRIHPQKGLLAKSA